MEWTFSIEIRYLDEDVNVYFLKTIQNGEVVYDAVPCPHGIISPFTMKFDKNTGDFKIMENNVQMAIKEYEMIFSLSILNINNVSSNKESNLIVLN